MNNVTFSEKNEFKTSDVKTYGTNTSDVSTPVSYDELMEDAERLLTHLLEAYDKSKQKNIYDALICTEIVKVSISELINE